ncbi:hypothetical protein MLD38_022826 [Melastoma candidum]|uniref:Uncharacterized protein n=1 Tax=Melastoma candidum TaxID=119954 RepID=A0ACB9QTQ5_9MYRT|nr:hypothetical protein MLD38_022826 [Melastoma candidum]
MGKERERGEGVEWVGRREQSPCLISFSLQYNPCALLFLCILQKKHAGASYSVRHCSQFRVLFLDSAVAGCPDIFHTASSSIFLSHRPQGLKSELLSLLQSSLL